MVVTTSLLALRSFPAFAELPQSELTLLASQMKLRSYPKKATILQQGEPSDHIYFLVSGFVKITRGGGVSGHYPTEKRNRQRKELALAIFGPGHMLGELASLASTNRSASVIALSECNLIQLEHTAFIQCAARNPSVSLFTMRYLASRLVESNRQIELLRSSVEARIISLLRNLNQIGLPPEIFPSNAEIGRMVGASREMVSKVISKIQTQ